LWHRSQPRIPCLLYSSHFANFSGVSPPYSAENQRPGGQL